MYRQGVAALIINNDQEFLLVNLESFASRYFAVPGGGVEPGESMEEAVYRELEEELGLTKDSLQLVGRSRSPVRFNFKTITLERNGKEYAGSERYFFGFRFIGFNEEICPGPGEVRVFKWVPLTELKDYLLFDNQLERTLKKIKELFSLSESQ